MPAAVRSPVPASARLTRAMALSLLLHGLLLSLRFGVPGIGLPSLEAPWRERRAQADLQIRITGAGAPAEPAAPTIPSPDSSAPLADTAGLKLYSAPKTAHSKRAAAPDKAKEAPRAAAKPRTRPRREQPVIALAEPQTKSFTVPAPVLEEAAPEVAPPEPQPEPDKQAMQNTIAQQAAEAREAERQARERAEEEARRLEQERAAHLAREQRELEQAEAQRRELAERLALEDQTRRREAEAARRQTALALEKQQEEIRRRDQEQAAQRALELEAQRKEEARREEAARLAREASELEARKVAEEAARRQAALERQRQEEQLAARRKAEEEAASLHAREEAASLRAREAAAAAAISGERQAAASPRDLTGGLASRALEQARRPELLRNHVPAARAQDAADAPRRHSILGKIDRDVGLMMYVESWRLKVERNGNLNYRQSSADKARGDPVVTVAVRSDGSVEDIVIHRSSGRHELDEAVRRIVRINARYSAFPPELARRFDVIEIRRIWNFDEGLRILEEVR